MIKTSKSKKYVKKAKKLIPALAQTFSKAPYSYVEGVYPTYLTNGKGSHVFDVDGNEYIDHVLGLGPITLGYNYSSVDKAIKSQLKKGISFSIPHTLELELSEKLCSIIPGADMVKFAKTGSDAGTATIRAARAITKRDKIAYCGTGGVWHDWFTIITSRNEGIPKVLKKMIEKFEFNNIESLKKIFDKSKDQIAAVYIEPITLEFPKKNFLRDVKKLAKKNGAVLIFDEVVTGFRYANGGAQEFLGIEADLVALGKGMGNGMPLAAITGKQEYMEKFNDIFYSTTYAGEALSLAAGVAVVNEFQNKPVVQHFWKLGEYFCSEFNKRVNEIGIDVRLLGTPLRSVITCYDKNNKPSLELRSLFYQEAVNRGILFGPGAVLFSFSHNMKDIKKTLDVSETCLKILKDAVEKNQVSKKLKGKTMKQVMTF